MITNYLTRLRTVSKWRLAFYVILSILLANITTYVLFGFFYFLINDSVTLTGLHKSLVDIIGHSRYYRIVYTLSSFSFVFKLILFTLFFIVFYRREKKRYEMISLTKMLEEIHYISKGNFDYQLDKRNHAQLDRLATDINNIVDHLQEAVAEERHIEHTKNELITNVSHDLRTPLTSMIGYLGLIEQDKYQDEVELRHYTNIAYEKAQGLERLINELFEYTRMQDKRFTVQKEPIQIAEIIGQLMIQNQLFLDENEMICQENIASEPLYVLGDGEKIARVFENLLMNAMYYGKSGRYIDVEAKVEEEQVVITITNYGSPIPRIDLPHIFERFYRAEKSRAKHTGGSGLGLAIAKGIVTHHDGTIEAESDLDRTSFIVRLKRVEV